MYWNKNKQTKKPLTVYFQAAFPQATGHRDRQGAHHADSDLPMDNTKYFLQGQALCSSSLLEFLVLTTNPTL